jgi:hypothetical protein
LTSWSAADRNTRRRTVFAEPRSSHPRYCTDRGSRNRSPPHRPELRTARIRCCTAAEELTLS